MTKNVLLGLLACGLMGSTAGAGVVADYVDDFETDGTPNPGWSYLWNAATALESSPGTLNVAGLVNLVPDTNFGGDYETQANGTRPDAPPGSNLAAALGALYPGQGSSQAADGFERFVIAAYTVSAADIAANGNEGTIDDYSFTVPATSTDGVSSRIYVNENLIFPGETVLPPGILFTSDLPDGFPVPLGALSAGDTISVAIGSRANDIGDQLLIDYSIVLVPEPTAIAFIGLGAIGMLGHRRSRRPTMV